MELDKAKVGDWSTGEYRESEREYAEVEGVHGLKTVGDYYRSRETRYPILYLDPENGLVVHDVVAYEAWLKKLEGRVEEAKESDVAGDYGAPYGGRNSW